MSRNRRGMTMMHFAILLWAAVFAVAIAETIFHALGWIFVTAVIAAASYSAGRRNVFAQARRHLNTNARYGKDSRGRAIRWPASSRLGETREQFDPRMYRGGSLPREPVEDMDAVSAYPPEITRDVRSRLLADPLSGVRKLSGGNDNG